MTQPTLASVHNPPKSEVLDQLTSVAKSRGLDPLVLRLVEIRTWLHDDLVELEESALAILKGTAPLGPENEDGDTPAKGAARHLLGVPGKFIRPICLMMAARIGERGLDKQVRDLALTCELIHAATLLHDDVLDEGDLRRGMPASRIVYGNAASVLGGDHVLLHALKLAHEAAPPHIFSALLETIDKMVSAESHQLVHRGTMNPDPEVYRTVILGKTAVLFRWALRAGGNLAGLNLEQEEALAAAGAELGMAFQLVDDILDLVGDAKQTGKSLYADLEEGKMTWPLILASQKDPTIPALAAQVAAGDAEPATLVARLHALNTINETRYEARKHSDLALDHLKGLPDNKAVQSLRGIIVSAIERSL